MSSMTAEQARIVLQQMGGVGRIVAMTGAKDFVYGEDADKLPYVGFKFKGCPKANYVAITLAPDDTYTVRFGKIVKYDLKAAGESAMVYAGQLRGTFERFTGLYLSI